MDLAVLWDLVDQEGHVGRVHRQNQGSLEDQWDRQGQGDRLVHDHHQDQGSLEDQLDQEDQYLLANLHLLLP